MPITLVSLWCTQRTWIADGAHQTSTELTTISAFVPPWHQDLWPSVLVIRVNCLQPEGDSLLHVGDCCKPLASQVHIKVSKDRKHSVPHVCLATMLHLVANEPQSLQTRSRAQWLPSRWTAQETPSRQANSNRHFQATKTGRQIILRLGTILSEWGMRLNVNDDYVEVSCVPSATHSNVNNELTITFST